MFEKVILQQKGNSFFNFDIFLVIRYSLNVIDPFHRLDWFVIRAFLQTTPAWVGLVSPWLEELLSECTFNSYYYCFLNSDTCCLAFSGFVWISLVWLTTLWIESLHIYCSKLTKMISILEGIEDCCYICVLLHVASDRDFAFQYDIHKVRRISSLENSSLSCKLKELSVFINLEAESHIMSLQVSQVLHHWVHHFEISFLLFERKLVSDNCNLTLGETNWLLTSDHWLSTSWTSLCILFHVLKLLR